MKLEFVVTGFQKEVENPQRVEVGKLVVDINEMIENIRQQIDLDYSEKFDFVRVVLKNG